MASTAVLTVLVPVSIITGTRASSSRIIFSSVKPSMLGMTTSSRTRWGDSRRNWSSPSWAVDAVSVSYVGSSTPLRDARMPASSSTNRIRFFMFHALPGEEIIGLPNGHIHEESRATARMAFHFDIPVMFLDNLMDDRQAESGAFPLFAMVLRRVKRIEDMVQIGRSNAGSGVAHLDLDPPISVRFAQPPRPHGQ